MNSNPLNIAITEQELNLLEGYCHQFNCTKSEFIRGCLQILSTPTAQLQRQRSQPALVLETLKLRQRVASLKQEKADLEILLDTTTTHSDTISAQLQAAMKAAEAASHAKSTFLANMSHELRTPLNAILGFSQILSESPTLTQTQKEHLAIINRSGEHLLNLINDVLEMSKIEAGKMTLNLDTVALPDLLKEIQAMLKMKAEAKGLQLILEPTEPLPGVIEVDASKLRQILINLLGNAIKFTDQGQIVLRVAFDRQASHQASRLHFEVEDTGPGIAPAELAQIFEAFFQSESGRRSRTGSGLGLSISYQLVKLMGGELKVNSTVGQGTRFHFEILIQERPVPVSQPPCRRVIGLLPDQPRYRILVVDDGAESRLLLSHLLGAVGFEIQTAEHGQDAIARWQTWQPHLILMDWHMPVGRETTQSIRRRSPHTPVIIALSASTLDHSRDDIHSAGCDDLLLKPFNPQLLLETIGRYLAVEYRYEALTPALPAGLGRAAIPETATAQSPICAEALAIALPLPWLAQLHATAERLDSGGCIELIQQLPADHSELATGLLNLIHDFRFDILLELTAASAASGPQP